MIPEINTDIKEALLKEFKAISTLQGKFDFWKNTLKRKYVLFLMHHSSHAKNKVIEDSNQYFSGLFDFRISPSTNDERLDYNTQIFEDYMSYVNPFSNDKVLVFDDLAEAFEIEYEEITAKKEFIEHEIDSVKNLVAEKEKKKTDYAAYIDDSFFVHTYRQKVFKNKSLDLTDRDFDIFNLISAKKGEAYGTYYIFLKDRLDALTKGKETKTKPLNIEQKFLILDYLELLDKLQAVRLSKDKDKLLALLLGVNNQTAKETLSHYKDLKYSKLPGEKVKIRKNLKIVADLFADVGLKSVLKKVNEDLKKLNQ